MSGRVFLDSARKLSRLPLGALVAGSALLLNPAKALAQSAADTPAVPIAPAEAPVAPPPVASAPAPSEPARPSEGAPNAEPTPAPAPTPAPTPEGLAPKAEPPAGSAAFEPLPVEAEAGAAAKPEAAAPTRTAAATAAQPRPVPPAPPEPDDDDSGGLLGPFRIGALIGTGLPEVLNFGAQLKLTRFFGAGVNVGLIPTVKINYYGEAAQKYQEYDVYGHIYPFGGSFFLGAGVGYAQIDGTLYNRFRVSNVTVDVTSDATVRTLVLTPQIGFLKIFDVGFAVGFDLGAQIPIAPSEVEFNTVTAGVPGGIPPDIQRDYINPNDEKVRHTLDTVGRTPLPTFSFKIGWFL